MHDRPYRQDSIAKRWRYVAFAVLTIAMMVGGFIVTIPHIQAAHAASPSLQVIPTSGAYSSHQGIAEKGRHFGANESVNIYWNYTGPGTGVLEVVATTDSNGAFTTKFNKPLAPTGTYTIAGVGQSSGLVATASFTLLPALTVSPQNAGPGTKIFIHGFAFGNGETVNIYLNYTGPGTGMLITSAVASSTGSFQTTGNVPIAGTPGHVPIVGVGQTSNTTASYDFILYPPTLALAPLSGSAGSAITLSGYGFQAFEKVNIFWNNGAKPMVSASTQQNGSINTLTFTVPAGTAPGAYALKAVGQITQVTATNTYTVVAPGSSLSLASGPAGVPVSLSGQGYAPGETINILWNYTGPGTGTQVGSVIAGYAGTLSGSFSVPLQGNGPYTVAAVGTASNTTTQNMFTISNGLASNSATSSPSTSITLFGTGYQPDEPVQFFWDSSSGSPLDAAIADASGNISHVITLPASATPGIHSIIGIGQLSQQSFTASVTIDTGWGDFGFDYAHHRENPYENSVSTSNAGSLQVKWVSPSTGTGLDDSPVYANGMVYIVTSSGILTAYDAASGNVKWQFTPTILFPDYSSPLVDPTAGLVFYGTVSNFDPGAPSPFYALDAQTGALQWSMILPWNIYGFPTTAFKTIYIGTSREGGPGTLHALDEVSGHIVWKYVTNSGVWGAAATDTSTNTVFTGVGNPANTVVALDATTGAVKWQFPVPDSGPDDDVGAGLVVANGLVYADSKNGNLYAINESSGTLQWSTTIGTPNIGNVSAPAVAANGMLYVGSLDHNLYAINATTGALVWKAAVLNSIYSSPAVSNGIVYFASLDHKVYAVNATNGTILWSYMTGGVIYSSPIIVNGILYCSSGNGQLYAFS